MLTQQEMKEFETRVAGLAIRNMKRLGCSLEEAAAGTIAMLANKYPEACAAYQATKEAAK